VQVFRDNDVSGLTNPTAIQPRSANWLDVLVCTG
jgi:hypothetical protein